MAATLISLQDQLLERAATGAGIILLVAAALWLGGAVRRFWRLRHVPGPLLCKFTDLYRAQMVRTHRSHEIHQALHERYGAVVRLGPSMVSVSDPAAIPTIYPMRPGFPKGDFYDSFIPYLRGGSLPAIFTARDEALHKRLKSPVAPLYSLSSIMRWEPLFDDTLGVLFEQLDKRFVATGDTADLSDWLQYFAFDVMGAMTFSKRYGFLEDGADNLGITASIWNFMLTVGPLTQVPWLDKVLHKNAIAARLKKASGNKILQLAADAVAERRAQQQTTGTAAAASSKACSSDPSEKRPEDFLGEFLKLQQQASATAPPWAALVWTFSNVIAGSDSTATLMGTTVYHLLTHPADLARVRAELDAAYPYPVGTSTSTSTSSGASSSSSSSSNNNNNRYYPRWHDLINNPHLPYLSACVDEAARLHPPFSLPLERTVPPRRRDGVRDDIPVRGHARGHESLRGNRHRGTFGADADEWRPGRWLEGGGGGGGGGDDDDDEARRRLLAGSVLTFGAGRRVCLGRQLDSLEVKKTVAALVMNYELDLVDPKAYTVENSYFFRQKGILVKIRRRERKE